MSDDDVTRPQCVRCGGDATTCKHASKRDPVSDYYERIRLKQEAAHRLLVEAIERGAPPEEIKRLRDLRDDAGYTGD